MRYGLLTAGVFSWGSILAQTTSPIDSVRYSGPFLPEITVVARSSQRDLVFLPKVGSTAINAGKKNAVLLLDNIKGNVVSNTMRQVMAKVPGIHIWESDGSGIQIGISARGLSPNRSWEFNVRQNGYDIAADPFGYPEAYFSPPLQAVQRIEIVRGHGALQYGPQFGGLINYVLRNGSGIKKAVQAESNYTVGSNGLIHQYTAIGGQTSRLHYYSFYDQRSGTGWRANNSYTTRAAFSTVTYKASPAFSITSEFMYAHLQSQQPGGLTDVQVYQDARQSHRKRNWMDIAWVTGALTAEYVYAGKNTLSLKIFSVIGDRNSIGFLRPLPWPDTVLFHTGQYAHRTVDVDQYRNAGLEGRLIHHFSLAERKHTFSAGARLYTGATLRLRDGKGSTGMAYEGRPVSYPWPRQLQFKSYNAAVFAEQLLRVSNRFSVIPGFRYEYLLAGVGGINGYTAGNIPVLLQQDQRKRNILLTGIGTVFHTSAEAELYANLTRSYRPMQFADVTVSPTTDSIDPGMQDARGFNADIGYKGRVKNFLFFDVSIFWLQYNNRIGVITQQRADRSFYLYRTNVGNSQSRGIEAYAECTPLNLFSPKRTAFDWSLFASYAYTEAVYKRLRVITKNSQHALVESDLRNKRVENAPRHILRCGMTITYKKHTFTVQYNAVSGAFADANNTVVPSSNAQNGWIPGYAVTDLTVTCQLTPVVQLRSGVNNLWDKRYFTRRSSGYPGPGALPADGRSGFLTILLTY